MAEIGQISEAELSKYDGSDAELPLLVAVKGRIFDVSTGKEFYGPGKSYAAFAGKDASRALAKMSTKPEDVTSSLDGLSEKEIGVLDNWEAKFVAKYPVVGSVVSSS
ncbi:unnamed protein product [Calypogeia fissa]